MERKTYTVKQTAQILGMGINQTYEACRNDQIPNIKIGRRILVPSVALDEMLRQSMTEPEAA